MSKKASKRHNYNNRYKNNGYNNNGYNNNGYNTEAQYENYSKHLSTKVFELQEKLAGLQTLHKELRTLYSGINSVDPDPNLALNVFTIPRNIIDRMSDAEYMSYLSFLELMYDMYFTDRYDRKPLSVKDEMERDNNKLTFEDILKHVNNGADCEFIPYRPNLETLNKADAHQLLSIVKQCFSYWKNIRPRIIKQTKRRLRDDQIAHYERATNKGYEIGAWYTTTGREPSVFNDWYHLQNIISHSFDYEEYNPEEDFLWVKTDPHSQNAIIAKFLEKRGYPMPPDGTDLREYMCKNMRRIFDKDQNNNSLGNYNRIRKYEECSISNSGDNTSSDPYLTSSTVLRKCTGEEYTKRGHLLKLNPKVVLERFLIDKEGNVGNQAVYGRSINIRIYLKCRKLFRVLYADWYDREVNRLFNLCTYNSPLLLPARVLINDTLQRLEDEEKNVHLFNPEERVFLGVIRVRYFHLTPDGHIEERYRNMLLFRSAALVRNTEYTKTKVARSSSSHIVTYSTDMFITKNGTYNHSNNPTFEELISMVKYLKMRLLRYRNQETDDTKLVPTGLYFLARPENMELIHRTYGDELIDYTERMLNFFRIQKYNDLKVIKRRTRNMRGGFVYNTYRQQFVKIYINFGQSFIKYLKHKKHKFSVQEFLYIFHYYYPITDFDYYDPLLKMKNLPKNNQIIQDVMFPKSYGPYETMRIFGIDKQLKRKNISTLELTNIAPLFYTSAANFINNKSNMNAIILKRYVHNFYPTQFMSSNKKVNVNVFMSEDTINNSIKAFQDTNNNKKYNIIFDNINIYSSEATYVIEEMNFIIKINALLNVLQLLKKGGNLMVYIHSAYTDLTEHYLAFVSKLFKEYHLYTPKIHHSFKMSGTILILKNFNGTQTKTQLNQLNKINIDNIEKYRITYKKNKITSYDRKTIAKIINILGSAPSPDVLQKIESYTTKLYLDKISYFYYIEHKFTQFKDSKLNYPTTSFYNNTLLWNYVLSYFYANKFNLPLLKSKYTNVDNISSYIKRIMYNKKSTIIKQKDYIRYQKPNIDVEEKLQIINRYKTVYQYNDINKLTQIVKPELPPKNTVELNINDNILNRFNEYSRTNTLTVHYPNFSKRVGRFYLKLTPKKETQVLLKCYKYANIEMLNLMLDLYNKQLRDQINLLYYSRFLS